MTNVVWTHEALIELLQRAPDPDVAFLIHRVACTELPHHVPPDGGSGRHPLLWRRAITRTQRLDVDRAAAKGRARNGWDTRPWRFLIIFRKMWGRELDPSQRDGFVVLAVLRDDDIAAGYEEIIEAARPTRLA